MVQGTMCASPWPGSPAARSSRDTGPNPSTQTKCPRPVCSGLTAAGSSFRTSRTMAPPSVRMASESLSLAIVSAGLPSMVAGVCASVATPTDPGTQRTQSHLGPMTRYPLYPLCPLCPWCPLCSLIAAKIPCIASPIPREHARHLRRLLSGQLPAQQRHRDESGRVVVVHERLHRKAIAELLLPRRQQLG